MNAGIKPVSTIKIKHNFSQIHEVLAGSREIAFLCMFVCVLEPRPVQEMKLKVRKEGMTFCPDAGRIVSFLHAFVLVVKSTPYQVIKQHVNAYDFFSLLPLAIIYTWPSLSKYIKCH